MTSPAFHHSFLAMNTRLSLVLPATGVQAGASVSEAIRQFVDQRETLMSRFRNGLLGRVNREAARRPCSVPPALWDVLLECRRHHHLTDGAFAIVQGIANGMAFAEFDDLARTVHFTDSAVYFDLGGIGKGIALRGVETILRQHGVTQAFVSFGESSLLTLGEHPAGGGWSIGLADGADTGFTLIDEAMSVSAQTEDHRHIIDPRSGEPVWPRTVAVAGPCAVSAEVLSTALCVARPEDHAPILARYPHMRAFVKPSVQRVEPACV